MPRKANRPERPATPAKPTPKRAGLYRPRGGTDHPFTENVVVAALLGDVIIVQEGEVKIICVSPDGLLVRYGDSREPTETDQKELRRYPEDTEVFVGRGAVRVTPGTYMVVRAHA